MVFSGTVRVQQTACSREAEGMCAMAPLHLDAGLFEPPLNDGMQRAAPGKRAVWRPHTQEDFTNFRLWPATAQIVQQRIADGSQQG